MHVLITGGTGFIGKALVFKLLKGSNSVAVISRNKAKIDDSLKAKIKVYEADICNSTSLERLISSINDVDVFFHLAACLDYAAGKKKLFQINVEGTLNVLNFAHKAKIKQFVYISSIEAIGPIRKKDIPADETYFCRPINFYGESKLEAERQVIKFAQEKDLQTIILRLGNVYGPGSLSFIHPIAMAILKGNKKYLYLNRNRYAWHPVYIDDVVEGIIKATQAGRSNETYILAGEEYVTVGRLSELIAQELKVDIGEIKMSRIEEIYLNLYQRINKFRSYLKRSKETERHWVYSIEKAKKELGYSPKVSLKDGIAKTLRWAKDKGLLAT